MAKILTTHEITASIERIIRKARSELVLISPYISISEIFKERLIDAKTDRIILIYGKEKMDADKKEELLQIPNLQLFFSKNLHAKIYYNEFEMIHTSMNLYEYSVKNNRETGTLFNARTDEEAYLVGRTEAESILAHSKSEKNSPRRKENNSIFNSYIINDHIEFGKSAKKGFCIRCRKPKSYNPSYPYCKECYEIWDQFGNSSYTENFCHLCGRENRTSMNKPECYSCYMKGY